MMSPGICTQPLLPLRSDSSEQSEMTSQLLFGELFEVLEEHGSWSKIRNLSDDYQGWCTTKMLQILPFPFFETLKKKAPFFTNALLSACLKQGESEPRLFLPAGSRLYFLDEKSKFFPIWKTRLSGEDKPEKEYWSINPDFLGYTGKTSAQEIVRTAKLFMNAPYLWGGKSILGIDCSGFTQLVYSIVGIKLPRDARDQAVQGKTVSSLFEAEPGDLAFFSNAEGRVVHVGILLDQNRILHASGNVHIDSIDSEGIYSEVQGKHTHFLFSVKRILGF
ncbi:MAG: C40 family peptidase [Bacteroidales bacterium]|nr:C40 family peptidase [Bacteroidales bacterium]